MSHAPVPPAEEPPVTPAENQDAAIDYGVEARRAALEDGSGAGAFLARERTTQGTLFPAPRRYSPQPPAREHPWRGGGKSGVWGPSGRDESRMRANAEPATMTTAEVIAAARTGLEVIRAERAAREPHEEVAESRSGWRAPEGTATKLGLIMSDRRTQFMPETVGEMSRTLKLRERLHPDRDTNSIDGFLSKTKKMFMKSGQLAGLGEIERVAKADELVRREIGKYGEYARDAAQKMADLKAVDAFLETAMASTSLAELLPTADTQVRRGLVALVQQDIIREVAQRGESASGVDPFLSLGTKFDQVVAKVGTDEPRRDTQLDHMVEYVEQLLQTTSVGSMRTRMHSVRVMGMRRHNFWANRVLGSIQGVYREEAQGILSGVWQT